MEEEDLILLCLYWNLSHEMIMNQLFFIMITCQM